MRRHIDHVRSRTTDSTVEMALPQDSTDEDEILFDTPSPVTPRHEPNNDDNGESSVPNDLSESFNVELRRSNRTRQPPVRFPDSEIT